MQAVTKTELYKKLDVHNLSSKEEEILNRDKKYKNIVLVLLFGSIALLYHCLWIVIRPDCMFNILCGYFAFCAATLLIILIYCILYRVIYGKINDIREPCPTSMRTIAIFILIIIVFAFVQTGNHCRTCNYKPSSNK